ncbi:HD-GYP domain-containing protein [Pseudodesulfovibrio sediminis]|uniref:HD-GYP domain-containing protein n=1 Tax=Pseudodesulfovibrio sediminis TaxID=2810563 RepID=A0ABM7P6W1_9BACT|nr:HD domain-containing phosphohydrolase [Pseudodesulfovibrio sediminis]BCS88689.1 hypothetical protein PSDVSF_19310 [Pseudodesulfovibrio sediminis]
MTKQFRIDEHLDVLINLARDAEARNITTAKHSERVALVARGIARELGLTGSALDRMLLMGRLHNIGIVGVRDSVLLKTDALTDAEFKHIQSHTTRGAELLAPIPSLSDVAEVCLSHHERWNGTGYPNGIKGEEIPYNARIIAVADVFVAIKSERPHRDSMPRQVAADIIEEEKGTLLCPECVEAFGRWFSETGGKIDLPERV